MWCRNCKTEYAPDKDFKRCPECGAKLLDLSSGKQPGGSWMVDFKNRLTDNWPCNENGEPEKAAFLTHSSSVDMGDRLTVNMLNAYGIPVIKYHPESGGLGKIVLGISGFGSDLYVPESMLDDAKALLEDTYDD